MTIHAVLNSLPFITLIFMLFDILSGFIGAVKNNNVKSEKMRQGLWHKSGFIMAMALGALLDFGVHTFNAQGFDLGISIPDGTLLGAICTYIIITEIASIIENLQILNPDIANSPLGKIFKEKEE